MQVAKKFNSSKISLRIRCVRVRTFSVSNFTFTFASNERPGRTAPTHAQCVCVGFFGKWKIQADARLPHPPSRLSAPRLASVSDVCLNIFPRRLWVCWFASLSLLLFAFSLSLSLSLASSSPE
jgi:hypothetical protein